MSQTTHFAITMLWTTLMFCQKSSLLFPFSQKLLLKRLNTTCFRLTGSDLNGEHGVRRDEKQLKSKQHIDSEGKSPSAGALQEFSPNLRNKNKHPLFSPPTDDWQLQQCQELPSRSNNRWESWKSEQKDVGEAEASEWARERRLRRKACALEMQNTCGNASRCVFRNIHWHHAAYN